MDYIERNAEAFRSQETWFFKIMLRVPWTARIANMQETIEVPRPCFEMRHPGEGLPAGLDRRDKSEEKTKNPVLGQY